MQPKLLASVLGAVGLSAAVCASAGTLDWKCESKFGPNDQIGNANHITPEKTLAATKLVTKGKAYRLGIEVNSKTPAYPPRYFTVTVVQPGQTNGATIGPEQAHLQRRHHRRLERRRPADRRLRPHRHRRRLLQLQQGRHRQDHRAHQAGYRERSGDRHARHRARHDGADGCGHREGRHRVQPRRDRGRHEAPGREEHRQG